MAKFKQTVNLKGLLLSVFCLFAINLLGPAMSTNQGASDAFTLAFEQRDWNLDVVFGSEFVDMDEDEDDHESVWMQSFIGEGVSHHRCKRLSEYRKQGVNSRQLILFQFANLPPPAN